MPEGLQVLAEDAAVEVGDGEDGGSGGASIAGYEYQIDVSVWLALDLMLANRLTHELILEPASEEDLEADLAEHEPGRLTSNIRLDDYRLIVQAKLRTGDAWTVNGVKALLKHGEVRPSAVTRLSDHTARYLLVTSAALNGGTKGLRVRRAGIWPQATDMPVSIKSELPVGAAGRVAIIGSQDEERISSDIKKLLTETFRTPNARWEECRRALRDEARSRIAGAGGGRWTRPELESLIRRHDGYIASSPELEHYVHPTNWADVRRAMKERSAALIIGPSGTGKTMATKKLYEELRQVIPGLARVPITLGPQQMRDDRTEPPVLYDIEDPWGRFAFDPRSRPWNDQLAQLLAGARHDRMIIATSRFDVAQSTSALDEVRPWLVWLEAEHYGSSERRRLYRTRIDALPRKLQALAKHSESTVLAELATPLEIQKFFDALPTIGDKKFSNPPAFVSEAIRRAHQNSIERTVLDQIEERNDVRAAAVVWGLLKANDRLSLALLRVIEDELAYAGPQFEKGVLPFITFFVAARNLRQVEATVTYYHPRVEAGIEYALRRDRLIARKALRLLIDILLSPDGPGKAWGVAASARLIAAADQSPDLKPEPSPGAQAEIDAWIAAELAKGGKAFESNLDVAAAAGSADSNVSEVARFLLHRPDRAFGDMHQWGPPEHDEVWYERMHADAAIKPLIERYIQDVMPRERDYFRRPFVSETRRLASNLTPAFLAAAAQAVHYGVTHTSEAIAEGALDDLDGFEAIVDGAVEVLTPSEADRREAKRIRLAITNGEYSQDYGEHLADNDDGYTAGEFLEAYVDRLRRAVGWRSLAQHRHLDRLRPYWFRAGVHESAPDADEITGAFAAVRGTNNEDDLWHLLSKTWDSRFGSALVERVLEGHPERAVRMAALTCLVERAPQRVFEIGQTLISRGQQARLVEIAIELGEIRHRWSDFDGQRHAQPAADAAGALPAPFDEISAAAFALNTRTAPTLSEETRALIESAEARSEEIRIFRLRLDRHLAISVADDVSWLLANTDEASTAVEAIEAAIRHSMTAEVEDAITHHFSAVVARALTAVATPMSAPLPHRFLALAEAKGSPVRQALVQLLNAKPHSDHLPALLHLVKDEWSRRGAYYGGEDDFPIAQAAVLAIAKSGTLSAETAESLYRVSVHTRDPDLRNEIFLLLVRAAGRDPQDRLFELAVNPGKQTVRHAAAHALLAGNEHVAPEVIARISPQVLNNRLEVVASRLLLLLTIKGSTSNILKIAAALATNDKRRVLLLLAIWLLWERDQQTAKRIASMLPANHAAVTWALGGGKGEIDDNRLDDLGDPLSVDQVLLFMKPKPKKQK